MNITKVSSKILLKDINMNEINNLSLIENKDKWTKLNDKLWSEESTNYLNKVKELYLDKQTKQLYALKLTIPQSDKVHIIGDIHSSLASLRIIFNKLVDQTILDNELKLKQGHHLIFLGDVVDRGPYSIELLLILSKLKLQNPNNVYIINGNHEDKELYDRYGLSEEIENEGINTELIQGLLERLPVIIFLKFEQDEKWFQLCHGGIDETMYVKTINEGSIDKLIATLPELAYHSNGLKWGDFNVDIQKIEKGSRGPVFGVSDTATYLNNNNLYSIISGHQDYVPFAILAEKVPEGFKRCNNYALHCLEDEKIETTLDPTKDFKVAITSTSTESKNIPFDTYLTLSKSDEHQLKVHKFRTNENRHGVQKGGGENIPEYIPGVGLVDKAILLEELKKLQTELEQDSDRYFLFPPNVYDNVVLNDVEINKYISKVDTKYQIVLQNFIKWVNSIMNDPSKNYFNDTVMKKLHNEYRETFTKTGDGDDGSTSIDTSVDDSIDVASVATPPGSAGTTPPGSAGTTPTYTAEQWKNSYYTCVNNYNQLQNDFIKNQKELAMSQAKVEMFKTEITELKKKNNTLATDKLKLDSEVKDLKKKVNEGYSLKYDDNNFNMNGLKFKIKNSFPTHFILQTTVNLEDNDDITINFTTTKKFSEIKKTIDKENIRLSITKNGLRLDKFMNKGDILNKSDKWQFELRFNFPSDQKYRIYRIEEEKDRNAFDTFMESLNDNRFKSILQDNLTSLKTDKEDFNKELEDKKKELKDKKKKLEEENKTELEKIKKGLEDKKEKLNAENTSIETILKLTAKVEECKKLEQKEQKKIKDKSVKELNEKFKEDARKKKEEEDRKKKEEDARKKKEEEDRKKKEEEDKRKEDQRKKKEEQDRKKEKKKKSDLIDIRSIQRESDNTISRDKKKSDFIDIRSIQLPKKSEGITKVKLKKLI